MENNGSSILNIRNKEMMLYPSFDLRLWCNIIVHFFYGYTLGPFGRLIDLQQQRLRIIQSTFYLSRISRPHGKFSIVVVLVLLASAAGLVIVTVPGVHGSYRRRAEDRGPRDATDIDTVRDYYPMWQIMTRVSTGNV